MDLPFKIEKRHKSDTKSQWKKRGLICTDEEFETIYERYIYCSNCELCEKQFSTSRNRHMEHCHETGEFRNICCTQCNLRKRDNKISKNNTSGYKYIHKGLEPNAKKGYYWVFKVWINGKTKFIKKSIDLEKLIQFRDEWFKENPEYHT